MSSLTAIDETHCHSSFTSPQQQEKEKGNNIMCTSKQASNRGRKKVPKNKQ